MKAGYNVSRKNSNKYIRFDLANEGLVGVEDEFFIVDKETGSIDSWKPTQSDLLANDWQILDEKKLDDIYLLNLARSSYNKGKIGLNKDTKDMLDKLTKYIEKENLKLIEPTLTDDEIKIQKLYIEFCNEVKNLTVEYEKIN